MSAYNVVVDMPILHPQPCAPRKAADVLRKPKEWGEESKIVPDAPTDEDTLVKFKLALWQLPFDKKKCVKGASYKKAIICTIVLP